MILTMPCPSPLPGWLMRPMELRIDVSHDPKRLDEEIGSINDRIRTPGDSLHGIAQIATNDPELVFRCREADGEFYVYVEDVRRGQLVGYTVFNRLIEVSKRADRHVRAPHSKYDPHYQRRGLATAIYRWGLDAGLCLMTGARQSTGAHALWHSLARRYQLGYVDLRGKTLTYLGRQVSPQVLDDLHTRMILLGKGWTVDRFAKSTEMRF